MSSTSSRGPRPAGSTGSHGLVDEQGDDGPAVTVGDLLAQRSTLQAAPTPASAGSGVGAGAGTRRHSTADEVLARFKDYAERRKSSALNSAGIASASHGAGPTSAGHLLNVSEVRAASPAWAHGPTAPPLDPANAMASAAAQGLLPPAGARQALGSSGSLSPSGRAGEAGREEQGSSYDSPLSLESQHSRSSHSVYTGSSSSSAACRARPASLPARNPLGALRTTPAGPAPPPPPRASPAALRLYVDPSTPPLPPTPLNVLPSSSSSRRSPAAAAGGLAPPAGMHASASFPQLLPHGPGRRALHERRSSGDEGDEEGDHGLTSTTTGTGTGTGESGGRAPGGPAPHPPAPVSLSIIGAGVYGAASSEEDRGPKAPPPLRVSPGSQHRRRRSHVHAEDEIDQGLRRAGSNRRGPARADSGGGARRPRRSKEGRPPSLAASLRYEREAPAAAAAPAGDEHGLAEEGLSRSFAAPAGPGAGAGGRRGEGPPDVELLEEDEEMGPEPPAGRRVRRPTWRALRRPPPRRRDPDLDEEHALLLEQEASEQAYWSSSPPAAVTALLVLAILVAVPFLAIGIKSSKNECNEPLDVYLVVQSASVLAAAVARILFIHCVWTPRERWERTACSLLHAAGAVAFGLGSLAIFIAGLVWVSRANCRGTEPLLFWSCVAQFIVLGVGLLLFRVIDRAPEYERVKHDPPPGVESHDPADLG